VSERPDRMPESDVVELLRHHHREIRRLFDEVENSSGQERAAAFDRLRRLLAVHEGAEQEVVHRQARRTLPNGEQVVASLVREENQAEQMLEDLERQGVESPVFLGAALELRNTVVDHGEREEREEFPLIKVTYDEEQLRAMAVAVQAAEALATTGPRRGGESTANSLAEPYAALIDRARDLARQAAPRASSGGSEHT
jgi:hemerythrin superfamily protein